MHTNGADAAAAAAATTQQNKHWPCESSRSLSLAPSVGIHFHQMSDKKFNTCWNVRVDIGYTFEENYMVQLCGSVSVCVACIYVECIGEMTADFNRKV